MKSVFGRCPNCERIMDIDITREHDSEPFDCKGCKKTLMVEVIHKDIMATVTIEVLVGGVKNQSIVKAGL